MYNPLKLFGSLEGLKVEVIREDGYEHLLVPLGPAEGIIVERHEPTGGKPWVYEVLYSRWLDNDPHEQVLALADNERLVGAIVREAVEAFYEGET